MDCYCPVLQEKQKSSFFPRSHKEKSTPDAMILDTGLWCYPIPNTRIFSDQWIGAKHMISETCKRSPVIMPPPLSSEDSHGLVQTSARTINDWKIPSTRSSDTQRGWRLLKLGHPWWHIHCFTQIYIENVVCWRIGSPIDTVGDIFKTKLSTNRFISYP